MQNQKVYIARNYRSKFDAAGKAKMDCETILENNGWKNIGFKQTWIANSLIGTLISALGVTWALLRLQKGSTLCLQYPFNKFYQFIPLMHFSHLKDVINSVGNKLSLRLLYLHIAMI